MRLIAFAVVIAAMLPARAMANDDPAKPAAGAPSPNDRICENIVLTGSRIGARRFCGTRAEWEDRKKQDRDVVDDAQKRANAPCQATMTHTGAPSC
jgi:hypothetical protein